LPGGATEATPEPDGRGEGGLSSPDRRMDDQQQAPPPSEPRPGRGIARAFRSAKARVMARAEAVGAWLERQRQHVIVLDVGFRLYERDRAAAGAVTGSAVAFRLFLFFIPFLLFAVGILGFVAAHLDRTSFVSATGVTGKLAEQIETAFSQPNSTRWLATLVGLFGILTAGRTLARVLAVASALSWQIPVRPRSAIRVIGIVVGTAIGMVILAILANRLRDAAGTAVAYLSFVPIAILYTVAWALLSLTLPRATPDPSAVLPGAALFGLTLAGMEAVTQLYLPSRFEHASALYGSIGVTVVTLGWFFILGRVIVLSMTLNAVIYERIGSIAKFVFGLPVLRTLPRRSPRFARFMGLDTAPPTE
jgi:membrane protein